MQKVAFFDRDGTLNVDVNYLFEWSKFQWIDGVKDSLRDIANHGYKLAIITNQSGIARGMYTAEDVEKLHREMNADLKKSHGVSFEFIEFCPHHPAFSGACDCRKPSPVLLERVASRIGEIDKDASFFVGDKDSDIEAAKAFGIRPFLVKSGQWEHSRYRNTDFCVDSIGNIIQ